MVFITVHEFVYDSYMGFSLRFIGVLITLYRLLVFVENKLSAGLIGQLSLYFKKNPMISSALQFTCDVMGQFLKNRLGLDENKVLLNNLIEGNGSLPQENQNKIIVSLINIEKETSRPFYNRNKQLPNDSFADTNLSERYNLDILISANFENYNETLKFLDEVLLFFQINNSIDASSSSNMPDGIPRLEFEIEKITYHQMQSLWTAMGAKYQPSVIYKMRLITIQGNEADRFIPAIKKTSAKAIS